MPGINGTGPQGAGPMTGRGFGYCNNANENAQAFKKGMGMRMGRGYNCRGFSGDKSFGFRGYYGAPQMTPEQQKDILDQQKSFLENELTSINEQIEKL